MYKLRTHTLAIVLPLGSVGCFIGSNFVARLLVDLNDGFGAGDLRGFAIFSTVFALVFLLPAALFAILFGDWRLANRLWLAVLLGAIGGFGWTLLNLWYLGPWFGAWSFPVLYCWMAGGVFGLFAVALLLRNKARPI